MRRAGTVRSVRVRGAALAAAGCVLPLAAQAQEQTQTSVDVSVGALGASNPYLRAGDNTESGAVTLSIAPHISVVEDNTTVSLDGTLHLESFFEDDYGVDESAGVGASIEHRANERTTVSASVGFRSSESAARRFYSGPDISDLDPGEFPDGAVVDPTLGNISGRTSTLDVNLSLEQLVSPKGVINLTSGLGLTKVEGTNGSDYRNSSTVLGYSHVLNERTSALGSVSVGYADYFNRNAGDGLFVTTLVGLDHQITQSMHGSFQVGVSYSEVKSPFGGRVDSVDWAASVDLCDMLARGNFCVTGSRSAQPTSLGGVTMVTAVGVSYGRSVGIAGHVSLTANYSKTGMSDSPTLLGRRESEVVNVSGTYSHQIGDRLSAFVNPSYTSNDDQLADRQENYQALLGVSYHFGSRR